MSFPDNPFTPAGLEAVLTTDELARRPCHPADPVAEARALTAIARAMATDPAGVLQTLADQALALCRADSAGVSILEPGDEGEQFRWHAIAGRYAPNLMGTMARNASPCGVILDRNSPLLFAYPERHFPFPFNPDPPVVETLLIPFHIATVPVGTVWVIAHTPDRKFDAEDARVLTGLSRVASACYRVLAERGRVPAITVLRPPPPADRPADLSRGRAGVVAPDISEDTGARARLAADPGEIERPAEPVAVRQTGFFRDPEVWARLERCVPAEREVRAWVAGCSTGEEAFTLAAVLAEAIGPERRMTVFAGDVNESAIATARAGRYSADQVRSVPTPLRDRYFRPETGGYVVRPGLRGSVVFARHDLLLDPPFGRMDLIVCRDTLGAFSPEAQTRVLARLRPALRPGGRLVVGPSDRPDLWSGLFEAEDRPHGIYRPVQSFRSR